TAEGGCDLRVFIDGQEDHGKLQVLRGLPPGRVFEHKFTVAFPRSKGGAPVGGGDDRETKERKRRLGRGFYRVRVSFGAEQAGLNVDNTRDLVMEVRKRVPTLVVDGNRPELRGARGDIAPLEALFEASGTFDLEQRSLEELEKTDLDLYPSIILLN